MRIAITDFGGIAPSVNARELANSQATIARNCRVKQGVLKPIRSTTVAVTPTKAGVKTGIYLYRGVDPALWLTWTSPVSVVKSLVQGDVGKRIYYTGDGYPKKTNASYITQGTSTDYPNLAFRMGVPAPAGKPTISRNGNLPQEQTTNATEYAAWKGIERVCYVYTYVTKWGEEGPPSMPSEPIDVSYSFGNTISIANLSVGPEGNYLTAGMTKRLYRLAVGVRNAEFQFHSEIPLATASLTDSTLSSNLGETIISADYNEPPDDLHDIFAMPNGVYVGFSGNQVCMCEPYQPHAWPIKYRFGLDYEPVGGTAFGTTAVIATKGKPYTLVGVHPAAMSLNKVEINQPCVAARSIVDIGSGVIYASSEGLVFIGPTGPQIATAELMDKDTWQNLFKPESICGCLCEDEYMGFYDNGVAKGGFLFNLRTANFRTLDLFATACFTDPATNDVYLAVGGDILKWASGAAFLADYEWQSGVFAAPYPSSMAAARVLADSYPVNFQLFTGSTLLLDTEVQSRDPFRLPDTAGTDFCIKLSGTAEINEVVVASSMQELT